MKKIILHDQQYSIGGPKAVLDGIENSYLHNKYEFVRLEQRDSCGFNPFKAIKFVNSYRKRINDINADAIYICGLEYVGFLMTLAARFSNVKKVILSVHGSNWATPNHTIRKWLLMHIIEPIEIRLSDSVFTVCKAAQRIIKPLHNQSNNDGVIYNTFPNEDWSLFNRDDFRNEIGVSSDKIVVASVGRVVEDKGHKFIIDAIKQFSDDRYVFVIVGEGDYLGKYSQRCKEEIEKGRVFLLGRRTDVNRILKGSDIFLFASFSENHSIALLESVNMHCCALCTDVGGNPEIIHDRVSGLLIPKMNSKAIINGLLELSEPSIRREYANAAYDDCKERFSVENTYGKLDKLFSK